MCAPDGHLALARPLLAERHTLVWLSGAGWRAAIDTAQPGHRAALAQWAQRDWPVVLRRQDADVGADEICLGLPLPPDAVTGAKLRISLRIPVGHIARSAPTLELREAVAALAVSATPVPASIRHARLTALCDDAGTLRLRVFGSLAMQALTGLPYLSPSSDVDVLFHPSSQQQMRDGIALLARHAEHLPLDGELVFPGGAAVSWKEWHSARQAKVLVKEFQSVRLAHTADLLAMLPAHEVRQQ